MDPVSVFGPRWEALGNNFGSQNVSKKQGEILGSFLEGKKVEKKVAKKREEN